MADTPQQACFFALDSAGFTFESPETKNLLSNCSKKTVADIEAIKQTCEKLNDVEFRAKVTTNPDSASASVRYPRRECYSKAFATAK